MSTQKQQILKRCDLFFLMHRRDIITFTILLHAYHHTYNHHHHHDNHHSLPRHWLIMRFENWFWKLYHVETLYMQQLPDHGVKARLRLINLFLSMLNIFCHFIIFMQRTEITQNTGNVSWQNMASLACRHICHSNHVPERTKITK